MPRVMLPPTPQSWIDAMITDVSRRAVKSRLAVPRLAMLRLAAATATATAVLAPSIALAHPGGPHVHGFVEGIAHPLLGWIVACINSATPAPRPARIGSVTTTPPPHGSMRKLTRRARRLRRHSMRVGPLGSVSISDRGNSILPTKGHIGPIRQP